jgi:coatomer subunit beta
LDLSKAVGDGTASVDNLSSLSRIVQLTGFSDPVYAEAFVKVNKFDIILDVLLVNQTTETLQNLSIDIATLGDLKLVERPATQTVAGHSFLSL